MPADYSRPVCDSRLPGLAFKRQTAKQAIAEASLVGAAVREPGWQVAREAWRMRQQVLRAKLRQGKATEDDVRRFQAELKALELMQELADEIVREGHDAAQWEQKHGGQPDPQPNRGEPANEEDARTTIHRANAVLALVSTPGWKVLVRHIAARARAHDAMLPDCEAKEAAYHRAAMQSLAAPLLILDEALGRGEDAEAWLKRQEETRKESGNG